ncbi:MAG TPA: SRPBCC family protein [Kofleriaceae bacterium]|nr:SRPBCC family protein [Kofleriaceae bacterium]
MERLLDLAGIAYEAARKRLRGTAHLVLQRSLIISSTAAELYDLWHRPRNLPRFLHHLEDVEEQTPSFSFWRVRTPEKSLTLRAVLVRDEPERALHWYTLGPGIRHEVSLELREARTYGATVARVTMSYQREGKQVSPPVLDEFLRQRTDHHLALEMDAMRALVEGPRAPWPAPAALAGF